MADKASNPRLPAGLGAAGKRLWTSLTADLEFEPREVAILEAACRQADDIARLEAQVKADGTSVRGSKGQSRLHPAVPELRQGRLVLARLLAALDIPPEVSESQPAGPRLRSTPSTRSKRAQAAANARWAQQGRAASGSA